MLLHLETQMEGGYIPHAHTGATPEFLNREKLCDRLETKGTCICMGGVESKTIDPDPNGNIACICGDKEQTKAAVASFA